MEPVTMLVGGGLVLVGWVLGRINRKSKTPKTPRAVCGCKHHHAHHDPKTGECNGTREVATKFNTIGTEIAWKEVPCTCKQYSGPEPITTYYAPELTE